MLKLGVIDVLNALPVYYGIIEKKIALNAELVFGKVTELNQKLHEGLIDISVISSFEFALNPERYYVLPNLSIGANGEVKSIYLFLNKPIEELDNDTIKLTTFSFTSVNLIRYILKDHSVQYTTTDDEKTCGQLLIADDAIRMFYKNQYPYCYDLAHLWKQNTGLPFVFALWCVRAEVYEKNKPAIQEVYEALIQSKESSKHQIEEMAASRFHGIFPSKEACVDYLSNIHFNLSAPYQEGFLHFQKMMVELDILPKQSPILFADFN